MATEVPKLLVNDVYAYYGRKLIERLEPELGRELRVAPRVRHTAERHKDSPVGILGAGIGGLYAALILESLNIKYKIIEASDRIGGRMFTHKFKNGGSYDYFDVGAMRFPNTDIMHRLFHLFEYEPLNQREFQLNSQLIPYYFDPMGGNGFMYFNDIREQQVDNKSTKTFDGPTTKTIVEAIMHDVTQKFADGLRNDMLTGSTEGWKELMKLNAYSARGYMSLKYNYPPGLDHSEQHLPTTLVNWCETLSNSTGSFDRSFSELVLEGMAFGTDQSQSFDWKCIHGGSQVLPDTIRKYLESRGGEIQINSRATSISFDKGDEVMKVDIIDEETNEFTTEYFEDVISTLPLPCLRMLDLQDSCMSDEQTTALRQLTYGPAVKVGVRFKSAWWTTGKDEDGKVLDIFGGQSSTDRPARMIVYPSYGQGASHTLIASYCWTEDAQRFGSLIGTGEKKFEDQIKKIILTDLALVHNVSKQRLDDEYVEHFAWNWHEPRTMGAFAFFGPGMFEEPYMHLTHPAARGHLHFAGEALSVRHAWVVGALDSAWRAVKEVVLLKYGAQDSKYREFMKLWGENMEWRGDSGNLSELGPDLLLRHLNLRMPELFDVISITAGRVLEETHAHSSDDDDDDDNGHGYDV